MALIGYARVSTEDQATFSQLDELKAAGCSTIFEEKASGASRARPELAKAIAQIKRGDILVVARIDRLARSLSHLLEVIEGLEAVGAHFKSLRDPIDTSTPQGKFALQVLGAAAELERALIRERTKAGLRAAKARGRVGGNPKLRERDPDAIRKLTAIRDRQYMAELLSTMDAWLPKVSAMRPASSWGKVAKALGRLGSPDRPWTTDRLSRAVRRLVTEGLADRALIAPASRKSPKDDILLVIAGIKGADPDISLRAIATRLEEMHIRTPRRGTTWSASSVKALLDRAERFGLVTPAAQGKRARRKALGAPSGPEA
ncbi:recombinase family protein [Azospirillum sp. TSO22-1]|uniref:recombinase family protein n=1 Tax=Azospirillum sp. TSO22-1 TaxID=716789 RepID=UPI000D608BBA|nr:recombinase family protein [Azospirillum sp. TSO22-1]PWC34856.1 DNA invertase [Azospirillum sp. TSO22-1]